ncbi:RidA family protein [Vibrio fluvialis]|nr:RidA family protein [Vibrio fluvialis]EME3969863.1 RidA family protein [Vibrio fluvialis]
MVQRVNYDTLPEAVGPYVHATKHNETLYLSGLTALGTQAQAGNFQEQCAEVLAQIEGVLKQEKRSKGDIVKVTIFLKDIAQLSAVREQLFAFYDGHLPACSLVEISSLIHSDLLLEMEAIIALQA